MAVPEWISIGSRRISARAIARTGGCWKAKATWKRGFSLSRRSGQSSSTSFSNGRSSPANASTTTSRTRPSSSRKLNGPSSRTRSARVLTKQPSTPSVSTRPRPATGEPTTRSVRPPWRKRRA